MTIRATVVIDKPTRITQHPTVAGAAGAGRSTGCYTRSLDYLQRRWQLSQTMIT